MNPIAIIGAGITGLAAAHALRKKGLPFTIYEAGPRCGGVIQTRQSNGFTTEDGPNTLMETSSTISGLVQDLGLEDRKIYSSPSAAKRYIYRNGRTINVPSSVFGFVATPLFSASAKCRLALEPFIGRAASEESLATFVERRLGREFLDYAINPLVGGIYAGDPKALSARHAFPKLHALEQRYGSLIKGQILGARERRQRGTVSKQNAKKFSFTGGLQTLIDALQFQLGDAIELQSRVTSLECFGGEWMINRATPHGDRMCGHSAVLCTAPAHKIGEMAWPWPQREEIRAVAKIPYSPVATLSLGFRREDVAHPLDGFGVLVPEAESLSILGAIFSSSLFPGRAPEGHVLLTLYFGGARAPSLAGESENTLTELAVLDLRKVLGVRANPVFRSLRAFSKAIPQYNMDYAAPLAAMERIENQAPGMFFAGNFREGISLGDAIVAGHHAASRVERFLALENRSWESANPAAVP